MVTDALTRKPDIPLQLYQPNTASEGASRACSLAILTCIVASAVSMAVGSTAYPVAARFAQPFHKRIHVGFR